MYNDLLISMYLRIQYFYIYWAFLLPRGRENQGWILPLNLDYLGCTKLKVLIFGEKPPCGLLDTFVRENIHAYFASSLTGKKAGNFQPLLIHFSGTIFSDMKNTTGFACGVLLAKILSDVMSDVLPIVLNCGIMYLK